MKHILFCTGEGIGNVLQCAPVLRTIKERLNCTIDMWHVFGNFKIPKIFPYVDKWFSGSLEGNKEAYKRVSSGFYDGVVSTWWTKDHYHVYRHWLPLLNKPTPLSMTRSEVDAYMDIARDLGVKEEKLIWEAECLYDEAAKGFDVVIHNGYNKFGSANWEIKSYPYYEDVVKILKEKYGFNNVASIGSSDEYIPGTVDMTGLPLLKSFGVIKNSKVLLSNDSGSYHAANALRTQNVVIFTATSIKKNFDIRFHKHSALVYRDLPCRPCQDKRKWNKGCKDWQCRNIDPEYIASQVYNVYGIAEFLELYGGEI
jgi:ADP-heptose:LPS heptosyltransferase